MTDAPAVLDQDLKQMFQVYERDIRVRNYRLCALLAGFFMIFGSLLDLTVYGSAGFREFIGVRLLSAATAMTMWFVLETPWGKQYHRLLGLVMAMPLIGSISWMIFMKEGAQSPYYAGLNLVMLGAAVLMRWSLADSMIIVGLTIGAYLLACTYHHEIGHGRIFLNNLYFLFVTGVFTTAGTWFYNRIRLSEFRLRYDLDRNRAELENANAQLEANNEKLRELDEAKSRFFANVSHELRTPLTLLIAPIESLMNRGEQMSGEEKADVLNTMHANSMRLLKLINDLLDLVRLEAGTVQTKELPVALEEFVHGLSSAVLAVAKDKRIQVQSQVEPDLESVLADPEKLERICLNLLFNALKFTPAGGTVSFTARRDGEHLLIEVRDTGMGIAPEQLPHIFNRFWQADTSSQRKFQGLGIGLALVKELTEAQGGSVSVSSELGHGTTMSVRLPFKKVEPTTIPAAEMIEEPTPTPNQEWIGDLYRRAELFPSMTSLQATLRPIEVRTSGRKKPRLLIADDEPDMLRFLKGQLSNTFDVLEAVDGLQAVEKAAQFQPDIIISDMMMPEKDGLQVCRELRERSITRSIPIVLLTARADEKTKMDCLAAGASDFLTKPFSMTEVIVRLKNLVDSSAYQKELALQKLQLEAAMEQLKETESILVQNEKLASLGRLSAGLIHEINNPLNYVRQGVLLLQRSTKKLPEEDREDFADTLADVKEGVDRVVQIISDLRGFTRTGHELGHAFDLKTMTETGLRFFAHEWKDGIQRTVEVPEGLEVRGDSNQFVQVLINLVQNALDAMESKTYADGESPSISITGRAEGTRVFLTITDNGPGIPPDIQDKIFDPFFTTKDVGKGMGLGLSICNRIVTSHGGRIHLTSKLGQNTEFTLEFPSTDTIIESHLAT